jgi:hypothetical protein
MQFPVFSSLLTSEGTYHSVPLRKALIFSLTACGGPVLTVRYASTNATFARIVGAAFDNQVVHNPCNLSASLSSAAAASASPPVVGARTVVTVDATTPAATRSPYDYDYANDYTWLAGGFIVEVACIYDNACRVSGTFEVQITHTRPFIDLFKSAKYLPPHPGVRVGRPAHDHPLLGRALHARSCWEVRPSSRFAASEARLPLISNASTAPFTVAVLGGGTPVLYGFYEADDPDGLRKLFATSSLSIIPQATDLSSFVRLSASVTRTLRTYRFDVGQVTGLKRDPTPLPDPWPPSAEALQNYDVTLSIASRSEPFRSGSSFAYCPPWGSDLNVVNPSHGCERAQFAQLVFHPALTSYDVAITEEYYPFDDSDAVQTVVTYLLSIPEIVIPLLCVLPAFMAWLARRFPRVGRTLSWHLR